MTPATSTSLPAFLEPIQNGTELALPADYSGVAMTATRALIRRGVRDLKLFCVPYSTLQADLLIGAGCVASVEAAAVTLGEFGPAPRFSDAACQRRIEVIDSTCPAIHAALQAAEKGVPFMPLRGLIGSDLAAHRRDWRLIDNPFQDGDDPITLLPAKAPEVALFHAPLADRLGNVWLGRRRELLTLAHAARCTLVTVERLTDADLFADEQTAAGVLPALYVDAILAAPRGAWPLGLGDMYPADAAHLRGYVRAARSAAGFQAYLDREVLAAA